MPAGRPSKRTPELIAVLLRAIKRGESFNDAAYVAGITKETLRAWRADDPELSAACHAAKVEGRYAVVKGLWKHLNKGDLKAIMYFLDRRHPAFREGFVDREDTEDVDAVHEAKKLEIVLIREGEKLRDIDAPGNGNGHSIES